jgi:uroporphyrinogen-III decarboxylase
MQELKQKLGGRMCLAGGMQAVELETGSPAQIRERVRKLADQGGPRGLILLPTSAPLEIPLSAHIVENYRAMFEAAAAYPAG